MAHHGCNDYCLTRRQFLHAASGGGAAGFLGLIDPAIVWGQSGPLATADTIILLWMGGGQSHLDTWDPKPGTDSGGPFETIQSAVDGIRIGEHLPLVAREFTNLSIVRSLTSREGSHERATYLMHTGHRPLGSIQYSTLGSIVTKMKGRGDPHLPPYVTIGGQTWPAGYLGSKHAAFHIADPINPARDLDYHDGVDAQRFNQRLKLLKRFDRKFEQQHRGKAVIEAYADHYQAAYELMRSPAVSAFDLSREPALIRERYGDSFFGQGCLLARRLAQVKTRFVEVTLPGWDTHQDNFESVKRLSADLDRAFSALLADLRQRDLLDRTLVVLCSEFGRTPQINADQGRDHWPRVWSSVLGGGGIVGGRVVGASTAGGEEVADRPCEIGELHATICKCLDIDPTKSNDTPEGRPIRVVEDVNHKPIAELLS